MPLPGYPDYDCIANFEQSAEARFHDALLLLSGGHYHGGIYLLGYSVEMNLKAAYYRLRGDKPRERITIRAVTRDRINNPLSDHLWKSGHGLYYWQEIYFELLKEMGQDLSSSLWASEFRRIVELYEANWDVSMRYIESSYEGSLVVALYDGADWIRGNCRVL